MDELDRLLADPDAFFAEKRDEAVRALADEAAARPVRFGGTTSHSASKGDAS